MGGVYSPKFSITNKILKNIGIIEACKEVIDHAPLLPYYERQFREEAMVRSVHYGTHIEGNELNLAQAEKVLQGQEIVGRERDIQEVINYREVMEYIGQLQREESIRVDEELVKLLHKLTVKKILPDNDCGQYRKTQVVIKNSQTGEISFKPPLAIAVPYQMMELLAFAIGTSQEDIHPVLKGGIVHYELVRIHPFLDGNGRVARGLSTLILFNEGYDIRKFFSLEEYFDSDSESYYQALKSVTLRNGELTLWLEYFTQGLAIELSKIKDKIEGISVDGKIKERLGGKPLMLSDRQLRIIEYIQKTGFLQNQAFKSLFPMISEDTILNELKALVQAGVVKKQGVTKGAKYIMS